MDDKIETLRERFKASQEAMDARKVIGFTTREPFVPEPTPERSVTVSEVKTERKQVHRDQDAIETLTMALHQAEAGHCRGEIVLMGLATTDDPELVTDVDTKISFSAAENPQIFAGGLRTGERDLFDLAKDLLSEVEDEE